MKKVEKDTIEFWEAEEGGFLVLENSSEVVICVRAQVIPDISWRDATLGEIEKFKNE